eukprot:Partr_v1_DN29030_c0_g2_i1_m58788 putative Transformation transcription domain-associated protein
MEQHQSLNFDALASQLASQDSDLPTRLAAALDLREHIEFVQTSQYPRLLASLIGAFREVLSSVAPSFVDDSPEQRLRNTVLEILQRLPYNDSLKPYAAIVLSLVMTALRVDNEENAAICLRVIIELHKNYRNIPQLEEHVQPFFDFFKGMLQIMGQNVRKYVDESTVDMVIRDPNSNSLDSSENSGRATLRSINSFKVLSECPIILVLLFQIYKKFIAVNIPDLVPLIVQVIQIRAVEQRDYAKPVLDQQLCIGPNPSIKNRTVYAEFIAAQVKIMSFLAYIIRGFSGLLKPHQQTIADSIICLLLDCPSEASATRKELLVAARHILSTEFRASFLPYIDLLFREDVLIGDGMTSRETLRPLAYSMLADLVHHIRTELNLDQISQTIALYTRNLHDSSLAPSIQTMCSKLLLNLIDCVVANPNKEEANRFLMRILEAFTTKFTVLKGIIGKFLLRYHNSGDQPAQSASDNLDLRYVVDLEFISPICTSAVGSEHNSPEIAKDYKFLFKTLVLGLKTIVYGLKTVCAMPNVPNGPPVFKKLVEEEVSLFLQLYRDGLLCFKIFQLDNLISDGTTDSPASGASSNAAIRSPTSAKEEKEILEHFVTIFTLIDPAVFHEIFQSETAFFLDCLAEDPAMLAIPQYLLASESVSKNFSSILLQYLMDNLEELGKADAARATLVLRLFKLVFMAVTLYPDANEPVLQPHIYDLIMKALKLSATSKDSNNYFLLMRALFRNIGGGRFELLYKEVLPLLPFLLKSLNALLAVAEKSHMRDLFVELCLTVPVRLSVLLPHLHHLMRPLVFSLDAGPELVSQGLRTLELCIDNLTAEFLDPILAPVLDDMMTALWKHLKPSPYSQAHSHATLRILGKLGGRNRRKLNESFRLTYREIKANAVYVSITFESSKVPIRLSLDECFNSVDKALNGNLPDGDQSLKQAMEFITASFALFIDVTSSEAAMNSSFALPLDGSIGDALHGNLEALLQPKKNAGNTAISVYEPGTLQENAASSKAALLRLLVLTITACSIPSLKEEAWKLCRGVATHFALVRLIECSGISSSSFYIKNTKLVLGSEVFLEAIYSTLTGFNVGLRKISEDLLVEFKNVVFTVLPATEPFDFLSEKLCASCYRTEWFSKVGGANGLRILLSKLELGSDWARSRQSEHVKALICILKDMTKEVVAGGVHEVKDTLMLALRLSFEASKAGGDDHFKNSPLITILVTELSSPNETVRTTMQASLSMIAEMFDSTASDVLRPFKERLLNPIFSKPLRALPFSMQIGNIDALTYCLNLDPPILEFNSELIRLIREARALADAEDQALTSRSSQLKNADLLVDLRTVCVKFLSVVQSLPEMNSTPDLIQLRKNIAHLFFKCMYSKSLPVVEAAKFGLGQAVVQQKIPKELLQTGLRPILLNLSEYKRLSVEGLLGLARLLELLTSYFKVEIGQKLLDHLHKWASPAALEAAANKPLSESNDVKIICGILDVIHLLPSGAVIFLNEMVTSVIKLENGVRRSITSPFRPPLIKFLSRFPEESVKYFLERIQDAEFVRLFLHILKDPDASSIREFATQNISEIVKAGFHSETATSLTRVISILIVDTLINFDPSFLKDQQLVIEAAFLEWNVDSSSSVPAEQSTELLLLYHRKRVANIMIQYFKAFPSRTDIMLNLVSAFEGKRSLNMSFLKDFIYETISSSTYEEFGRDLLQKSLDILANREANPSRKVALARIVLIPALTIYLTNSDADSELGSDIYSWFQAFIKTVIPIDTKVNALNVEYLQIIALLLKMASSFIGDFRKEIVKYTWGFLKGEDTLVRQSAYVVLSYFIREYETPPKIIIQVFVSLLRAYQSEARVLVKQALDVMNPALPIRLPEDDMSPPSPPWIRWTRKILVDDGHLLPQLIAIWQMIVRHPDLYFNYREMFVQLIVGSLAKLGMAPSSTTDTKLLTVDLAELIYRWECVRIEKEPAADSMDVDSDTKAATSFIPNVNVRDVIINYLIRFLCMNAESQQKRGRSYKIILLVQQFMELDVWQTANVKMSFLEKFFASTDISDANSTHIAYILQIILAVAKKQKPEWFVQNINYFQICIEKCLVSEDPKITENLVNTAEIFFQKISGSSSVGPDSAFVTSLQSLIVDSLLNGRNVYGMISILKMAAPAIPSVVDQCLPMLSKIILKLAKESPLTASAQGPLLFFSQIITGILFLMDIRLANLGDTKKNFFSSMALLIEKCTDANILKTILDMIDGWIFTPKGASLTPKEKTLILLKFSALESKISPSIFDRYMMIVLRVYKEDPLLRSEITVKIEPVFLIGTRSQNPELRREFVTLFGKNLPRNLFARLSYVIGVQNWEYLSNSYWLRQALEIVLAMTKDTTVTRATSGNVPVIPLALAASINVNSKVVGHEDVEESLTYHKSFMDSVSGTKSSAFVRSICCYMHQSAALASSMFKELFQSSWKILSSKERHDLNKFYVALLAKEHHLRQVDMRPNVVSTLLETAAYCDPPMLLPPQIVRYIGKTFNCWHAALEILQRQLCEPDPTLFKDYNKVHDLVQDSIADLYFNLGEDDLLFGLWRRRCLYPDTNAALSYEQMGMWRDSQSLYENAQVKARNGLLPFSEAEYCLWEDRWIICTQKLQQWDLCSDLAKHDSNVNLQLECAWRITDWTSEKESLQHAVSLVADNPSPRQKVFEAFLILSQLHEHTEKVTELQKTCDEGIQLALKQWHSLPANVGQSHLNLLHIFQQFVELQEASSIYSTNTSAPNRLSAIQELKGTLGTWRDRLPNFWEDINIWSQLVAWRQHVFSVINKNYQSTGDQSQGANSLSYRGFHEIAWIINRFAHVSRKHHLYDVCNNSLSKIYTLPNIEIQDAFLKLREQAKCQLDMNVDVEAGLEVINTTNLGYFQPVQRAEFFAFKGIFFGRLGMVDEANQAYSAALQIDANLPKGWSSWAKYNDARFAETGDISCAADAVHAYMLAASLYKNHRSRKYIGRVLWLLGFDDAEGSISKSFYSYKGEYSTWYWISFIPQLLNSLAGNCAHQKSILIRIAKAYPQALYLPLRTLREDYRPMRILAEGDSVSRSPVITQAMLTEMTEHEEMAGGDGESNVDAMNVDEKDAPAATSGNAIKDSASADESVQMPFVKRQPWEHVEEIMTIVKTAYPLLALSIETMTDQMLTQLKPTPDEDVYRVVVALLSDGLQYLIRSLEVDGMDDDSEITETMVSTITRFINSPFIASSQYRAELEADFVNVDLTLRERIAKYQEWQGRLAKVLETRPKQQVLTQYSHYLVEFEHQRFDDVEVPGQYIELRDNNSEFVKIDKIKPEIDIVKGPGIWYRRITFLGHDGTKHCFSLQIPSARHSRREERVMQLFRQWNGVLDRRVDTRKRGISFQLPCIVSLAPTARLVQDNESNVSLGDIFEDYCRAQDIELSSPVVKYIDTLINANKGLSQDSLEKVKFHLFESVSEEMIPDTVLSGYMRRTYVSFSDLWPARNRFTSEYSSMTFLAYIMNIGHRLPQKIKFCRSNGKVFGIDLFPMMSSQLTFANSEVVPFRLTPNIQKFMTPVGIEGVFVSTMISIANALKEHETSVSALSGLIVRDEVQAWKQSSQLHEAMSDDDLQARVKENTEIIESRIEMLMCKKQGENLAESTVPICQPILDMIATSTNPANLSQMEPQWMPWF